MNKAISWLMVALTAFGLCGETALAGSGTTNAPAAPGSSGSAMYTLNDIYNVLNTRTTNIAQRTGGFTEPSAGPANGNMYTLNDIMGLVTNMAPVAKTGWTNIFNVGDDGTYQTGVAWPNPRFTALPAGATGQETNQIRDNLTGLIWARNANIASNSVYGATGRVTWTNAFDLIANGSTGLVNAVNYGGTNDWRLPNRNELLSLVALQFAGPCISDGTGTNQWTSARGPFFNVQYPIDGAGGYYWSSDRAKGDSTQAWTVYMYHGIGTYVSRTTFPSYVWPVRGGGR